MLARGPGQMCSGGSAGVLTVGTTPICCFSLCLRLLFPGRAGRRASPWNCCSNPYWQCCLLVSPFLWVCKAPRWSLCANPVFCPELLSLVWQQSSLLQAKYEFLVAGISHVGGGAVRAVARGLLRPCLMPAGAFTLPCGRLDVGLSQWEHVFPLDSFPPARVPHLPPCAVQEHREVE